MQLPKHGPATTQEAKKDVVAPVSKILPLGWRVLRVLVSFYFPAVAHAPFWCSGKSNLSAGQRCVWPRPVFANSLWRTNLSARRLVGSGTHVVLRHTHRGDRGLLRRLEGRIIDARGRALCRAALVVLVVRVARLSAAGGQSITSVFPDYHRHRSGGLGATG